MSFRTSMPTPPRERAGIPLVHPDHPTPSAIERRRERTPTDATPDARSSAPLARHEHDLPAFERWLQLLLVAFVPATGAVWAPQSWRIPLLGVACVILALSVVMLAVQDRARESASR